jgi:hypothetical protein
MYNPVMVGVPSTMMNNGPCYDQGLEEGIYDDCSEDDDTSLYGEAMTMADQAVSWAQASMSGYNDKYQATLTNHRMKK